MSVQRGCCWHILNVDSTVQQCPNTENWILLSNSTKNSWNIYKFASHLWFKKSHNNREAMYLKVFSIEVPPCITAIVTSHKQIKWHDKWFSFDSLPISGWKPEIRQTSHKFFWYKSPGNTSVRRNNLNKTRGCHKKKIHLSDWTSFIFSVWQKQDQATKDFLLMDFMPKAQ